ncbi:trophoblast glycoprotein-like [Mya arenaria]|uniref:trophoblast glycoprotein-like n=1 Tax=Mya arenaria TaxID=6604 RepID=UPI0022E5BC6A|nr:trophoblast glycoprotein-like [Mya arenaria]
MAAWKLKQLVKLMFVFTVFKYSHGENTTCKGRFERCICTTKNVECHGESQLHGHNIINLYLDIDDHCETLTITHSNLSELQKNFFGSCHDAPDLVLKDMTYVELSNDNITTVHGKTFHCIPNLQTLIMSNNQWEIDRSDSEIGYFTSMPHLKHLDLSNAFEDGEDGSIFFYKLAHIFYDTDMTELEDLNLSYNEFIVLSRESSNSMCELTSLKLLNLSHNYFMEPSMPNKVDCFQHLERLDLSYNNIKLLSPEFMQEVDLLHQAYDKLQEVKLDNNPYRCDCELIATWEWLNTTRSPVNKNEMLCGRDSYHSSYIGKRILDLKPEDFLCQMIEVHSNTGIRVVTGIIFTVVGVTLVAFIIVNREKLRLCIKRLNKRVPSIRFRSHQGYATVQEVATV